MVPSHLLVSLLTLSLLGAIIPIYAQQTKRFDGQIVRFLGPDNRGGVIRSLMTKLAKAYTDVHGGRVEVLDVPATTSFIKESLFDIKNTGLYDGFYGRGGDRAEMKFTRGLLDLTDFVLTEDMAWLDIMLYYRQQSVDAQGRVISIPWGGNENMMYFREDILRRFGLSAPRTWEDLIRVAKAINGTDMNGDGKGDFAFCHSSPVLYSQVAFTDHYACSAMQVNKETTDVWFDAQTMKPRVKNLGYTTAINALKDIWQYSVPYEWWEDAMDAGSGGGQDVHFFEKRDCAIMFNFHRKDDAVQHLEGLSFCPKWGQHCSMEWWGLGGRGEQ